MEKIKIIYYNSTLLKGGTDTYMVELIKNIDKSRFQIDVIIKDGNVVDEYYLNLLKSLGTNIYLAKGNFLQRMIYLQRFFKINRKKYDICHINATSQGTGIISYFANKYAKIKKIIFHSHMGGNDNNSSFVDKIGKKLMFKYSTHFSSCSNLASLFMFGKTFCENNETIKLNNSIDIKKFKFNSLIRQNIRKELGISEKTFVILHVGRFATQKNHKRLIEIFSQIYSKNKDSKLLLIGNGELLGEVKSLVNNLNLSQNVIFLGLKNNVNEYMQAADCLVMPSIHEGLPIVAVEAQGAGLPCILSSNISTETKLADYVEFLSLEETDIYWADVILNHKNNNRKIGEEIIKQHNFDHQTAIKVIENLYEN